MPTLQWHLLHLFAMIVWKEYLCHAIIMIYVHVFRVLFCLKIYLTSIQTEPPGSSEDDYDIDQPHREGSTTEITMELPFSFW